MNVMAAEQVHAQAVGDRVNHPFETLGAMSRRRVQVRTVSTVQR